MNKKENIFEISVLGIINRTNIESVKMSLEEVCENNFISYKYDITTYKLDFNDGTLNISNLVELHQNIGDNYEKK